MYCCILNNLSSSLMSFLHDNHSNCLHQHSQHYHEKYLTIATNRIQNFRPLKKKKKKKNSPLPLPSFSI